MNQKLDGSALREVLRAAAYAATQHAGQKRKDKNGTPYINHPIGVAEMLTRVAAVTDPKVLQAALLHDTIEDTATTPRDLTAQFGARVCSLVLEVTDDEALPKPECKRRQVTNAPNLSREARLIRVADKIYNCGEIRADSPANWSRERKLEYLSWAEEVVNRIRGTDSALEKLFAETIQLARRGLGAEIS